jgi:hypothetical protein
LSTTQRKIPTTNTSFTATADFETTTPTMVPPSKATISSSIAPR